MSVSILRDLPNAALIQESIAIRTVTQTTTGTAVDMITGDGRCVMLVPVVATSLTQLTVRVQQSTTTSGTFADVSGASLTATTSGVYSVSFDRDQRALQAVVVINGTTAQVEATFLEAKKTF